MPFENGISFYKTMYVAIPVHFPEGHVACQYCKLLCRYEENFQRYSCRLTDEWLMDVKHSVGRMCPLVEKEM